MDIIAKPGKLSSHQNRYNGLLVAQSKMIIKAEKSPIILVNPIIIEIAGGNNFTFQF